MAKLKFKLGLDANGEKIYECKICHEKMEDALLESHAIKHNRNSYLIDIDIKKDKTDGKNLLRSV